MSRNSLASLPPPKKTIFFGQIQLNFCNFFGFNYLVSWHNLLLSNLGSFHIFIHGKLSQMCNIDYLSSQDMFPDVELVYSVRNELDTVIEEGVSNIVQLLRNADSGSTSGAARAGATDEDAFESKNRKIRQG